MADNKLVIPILNPLKFVEDGYSAPAGVNGRYFDDFEYVETIRNFEADVMHLQPWQQSDNIRVVLLSNFAPFTARVVDCAGVTVSTVAIPRAVASTDASGLFTYAAEIPLSGVPAGIYRVYLDGGDPQIITLKSEWFRVAALHENSVKIEYSHDQNDFDVPFELGFTFTIRTLGGLSQFKPVTDRVVFIDQPRNAVTLDSKPYHTRKLFIGDAAGVPDWFIERVNAVFCCATVLVDGVQYVAADGAQVEPNREADYPLAGWSIEIRPAKAKVNKTFTKTAVGGGALTTLVYNIESRGFGPGTAGGSGSPIQIIATE